MNILIYEYAVSEGHADGEVSAGILSEGFGMLRSAISDFKRARHQVATILSDGLKEIGPPLEADSIVSAGSSEDCRRKLKHLADESDAALVIAPEPNGKLQDLITLVERSDAASLNSNSEAVGKVSNKTKAHDILERKGFPVPKSRLVHIGREEVETEKIVKDLEFPLVLKPVEGVGCEGLSVIKNKSQTAQALSKLKESETKTFIAQKYVEGTAASVSAISNEESTTLITLNLQKVKLEPPGSPSSYLGGVVPLHHQFEKEALNIAEETVKAFEGLRGYVGIDLVLTKDGPVILELNPRLTTSYIGARKVVETNLAQAIVEGILEGKIPKSPRTSGCSFFSKIALEKVTQEDLQKIISMEEVVSPPFPIPNQSERCLLALVNGKSQEEACKKFYNFRENLASKE